jgi:hypothetical protein
MDELTAEEINVLRDYIATPSGKKFLSKLVNYETTLLAEAFNLKSSSIEKQGQLVSRVSGIYWVRSMIDDLVNPKKQIQK